MKLVLKRTFKGDEYTIGNLYVDGKYFCDTIEDKYRDLSVEKKVYGETAIPNGEYKIIVNASPRFKRDLPRLLDVPHFEGILIHAGNTALDSHGCILVGENKKKGMVLNSRKYETLLVSLLKESIKSGEDISITVE